MGQELGADSRAMILAISGGTWIPFFSNPNNSRSMRSRSASCPSCRPSRRPFSIAFLSTASLAANIILPPVNGFWVGGVSFTGHGCHWTSQEPGADSRAMILAISGGTFIPFFSSAANSRSMRSRSASCPSCRPSCRPSRRPFSIAFFSTASLAANIILATR